MNEKRGLALAATALIAFGAGLIAYRWIVLGFTWSGSGSTVMLGVAIGGIAGGSQLARTTTEAMKRVPWWLRIVVLLGGLALGLGAGFLVAPTMSRVALTDHDVSHVTIGLPSGELTEQKDVVGKLFVKSAGGFETFVGVSYQPGAFDPAMMQTAVAALAQGLGAHAQIVEHDDFTVGASIVHASSRIEKDGSDGWATLFACGPEIYVVYTFGRAAETLHARVLASVTCRAKPGDAPAAIPAIADLPADWTKQPTDPGQLAWANADAGLIVRAVDGVDPEAVEKVFGSMEPALGGSIHIENRRNEQGRTFWDGSLTAEGQTMDLVVGAWTCPRGPALMAMYLHAPGTDPRPGVEMIMRVQCAR